ncbi:hypothetical protein D3C87_1552650 [compost metagenome]
MDALGVGDLQDGVGLHHVAAHARHARIGLVVHEEVATVIFAVGEGHMDVVQVAVVVNLLAVGGKLLLRLFTHRSLVDVDRFVGLAPAGGRATVEHRNPHQFAHRGNAENTHLARLA